MTVPPDKRPDPDVLLAALAREEERARRGRLKVYLGMCPGVGKTYAMLEAAQERVRTGGPVLMGIVETHRRAETEQLLEGIPVLPRLVVEHAGIRLEELDLDAALAAHPPLLLVDELAHTNADGLRHQKRWQDIRELLVAGIDVWTTLNIQHVETLNDVVAQITGVRMGETVPDSVLEEADEVMLVDLPPEELLKRLRDGKVYVPEQIERAAGGFFKPANLAALRELSLRFLAGRVGTQVQIYRKTAGAGNIWATAERLLVAVGPAPTSARLIRATKRLASATQAEWFALAVERPGVTGPEARERMAGHLRLAERLGAHVILAAGDRVADVILSEARSHNVTKIVIGKPQVSRWREWLHPSPVDELVRRSGDIDIHVIKGEGDPVSGPPTAGPSKRVPWVGLLAGLPGPLLIAGACWFLRGMLDIGDIALLFVTAVAATAITGSRVAAVVSSVVAVLLFNFFFIPPLFTLDVASPKYLLTFLIMMAVSLCISELTVRLRLERDLARRASGRAEAMQRFSQLLTGARGVEVIGSALVEEMRALFGADAHVLLPDTSGRLAPVRGSIHAAPLDEKAIAVATWAFENGLAAGCGTDTLASSEWFFLPLRSAARTLGVLAAKAPPGQRTHLPEQRQLLDALGRQGALALEVELLENARRTAQLSAEREQMRSAILSAVSHDLRTPLASILGSATSLQEQQLPPEVRASLLATITEEVERLNRLIANILEMTRIEAGAMRLNQVPLPVDEIVGAALHSLRRALKDHPVETRIPADLPFVLADELLVQQVVINLLENAAKHTPPGTRITLSAAATGKDVEVSVSDNGPGITPGREEHIFGPFHRGDTHTAGAGLGLAICQAIVRAHGGGIRVEAAPHGGADFRFTLPAFDGTLGMPEESDAAP